MFTNGGLLELDFGMCEVHLDRTVPSHRQSGPGWAATSVYPTAERRLGTMSILRRIIFFKPSNSPRHPFEPRGRHHPPTTPPRTCLSALSRLTPPAMTSRRSLLMRGGTEGSRCSRPRLTRRAPETRSVALPGLQLDWSVPKIWVSTPLDGAKERLHNPSIGRTQCRAE